MKFTIDQQELKIALGVIQRALPSRPQLPILSSILIEVTERECQLSATDLYFGVRSTITTQAKNKIRIAVPGKTFCEIISNLDEQILKFEVEESTLIIETGQSKTRLQTFKADDFPSFPDIEGEEFVLSLDELNLIEKYVVSCSSTDQTRPILTSILLSFTDSNFSAVATDGFRLSLLTSETKNSTKGELLVPAQAFKDIKKHIQESKEQQMVLVVSRELKQVRCLVGATTFFIRLIEGEFPPYRQILPTNLTTNVTFNTSELINHLKRARIFAKDNTNISQLNISEDGVEIFASSQAVGEYRANLEETDVSGESLSIAFNTNYLLDFLQSCPDEKIVLKTQESLKPAEFTISSQPGLRHVVMPFKIHS